MAIAFVSISALITGASTSVDAGSDANRLMVVDVFGGTVASNDITAITFNGVSLTKVAEAKADRWLSTWKLINPASGSNTLAITGGAIIRGRVSIYRDTDQTTNPEASSTNVQTSTSISTDVTTVTVDAWTHACIRDNGGATKNAISGYVERTSEDGSGLTVVDSDGSEGVAGVKTIGVQDFSGTVNLAIIGIAIKPDTAEPSTTTSPVYHRPSHSHGNPRRH